MPLFDSHAHYQDEKFDTLPGGRDALLRELLSPASDVCGILNAATDLPSSEECIALAEKYPQIYAAVGVHPEDCGSIPPEGIGEAIERLSLLCRHPKAAAIGEIGLDYYREENPPRAHQRAIFEAQLALAEREDLPVVVHDREAHGDTLEILLRAPPRPGRAALLLRQPGNGGGACKAGVVFLLFGGHYLQKRGEAGGGPPFPAPRPYPHRNRLPLSCPRPHAGEDQPFRLPSFYRRKAGRASFHEI